jgi:integrase/recombinase XerD
MAEIREQLPAAAQKILSEFSQHLRADGKSINTIDAYTIAVAQLLTKIKFNLKRLSQKSVDGFFSDFSGKVQTQNQKKNAIRKFLSYLGAAGVHKSKIQIKTKDVRRPDPEYLTIQEQDKLLQYVKGLGEHSLPYVIIRILLFTGLRIGELINLKFSDVHENAITLRTTKSRSTRRKRLKRDIGAMLKSFMKARREKWPLNNAPAGSNDYLFMSRHAGEYKPYTKQGITYIVKKYCREIGITKKISPHVFRHSFAFRYLTIGGSLKGLQHQLNHAGPESTAVYLHIADEQEQEDLEKL